MAKRTTVLAHDDTDGSEAAEQVSFALDGVSFEIDLSERNAGQLREVLAPFVQAARRVLGSAVARGFWAVDGMMVQVSGVRLAANRVSA